jgi:hypothetical protein
MKLWFPVGENLNGVKLKTECSRKSVIRKRFPILTGCLFVMLLMGRDRLRDLCMLKK